jgi:hypothetical protein
MFDAKRKEMRFALNILAFLVLSLVLAQPVGAGAWLRDKGTGFLSLSTTFRQLNGTWQAENRFYGEYGVAQRLTLGADINEITGLAGHALVFLRLPVGLNEGRTRMAVELGLGAHHRQGRWGGMMKSTFSVGRGFSSRWGNGWFNVDAGVEWRLPNASPAFKLDATIGLSSGPRIRPMLQIESTYIAGDPLIWSVIPGVMIDGRSNNTWLIGVDRKTAGQTSLGLKFGLWRRF